MNELDTLIRQAEMAVVESDRRWQRSANAVVPAMKATAGRAARGAGGAALAAAALWIVVSYVRRGRPSRFSHGSAFSEPARHLPRPRTRTAHNPPARGARRFSEWGGALFGSMLRSGLAPVESKASMPLMFGVVVPWFAQWWRKRHNAR